MQKNSFVFGGKKKIMGLDIGTKYIGIALSDGDKRMAFPKSTCQWQGAFSELKNELDVFFREESIESIVLGLPLSLDGTLPEKGKNGWATKVQEVREWLEETYSISVELMDERVSTQEAENRLSETVAVGNLRAMRKDAIAAQIILERYLDKVNRGK